MNLIARCRQLVGRLPLGRAHKLVVAVVGGSVVLVGKSSGNTSRNAW